MNSNVSNLLKEQFKILELTPPKTEIKLPKTDIAIERKPISVAKKEVKEIKIKPQVKPQEDETMNKVITMIKGFKEAMLDPLSENIRNTLLSQQDVIKSQEKEIDKFSKQLNEYYSKLQEAINKKLPVAPTEAEVTEPKNIFTAITKKLIPTIIGTIAMFKGGKYGENYVYFNAMNEAIKQNDLEKYKKALEQWKLDFERAVTERQQQLDALKIEGEKIIKSFDINKAKKDLLSKSLENEIKAYEKQYEVNAKLMDKIFNLYTNLLKIEEAKRYHSAMIGIAKTKISDTQKQFREWTSGMKNIASILKEAGLSDDEILYVVRTMSPEQIGEILDTVVSQRQQIGEKDRNILKKIFGISDKTKYDEF